MLTKLFGFSLALLMGYLPIRSVALAAVPWKPAPVDMGDLLSQPLHGRRMYLRVRVRKKLLAEPPSRTRLIQEVRRRWETGHAAYPRLPEFAPG